MYSSNYFADEGTIKIPENYNGTSLREVNQKEEAPAPAHIEIPKTEIKISPKDEEKEEEVFAPMHREEESSERGGFDIFSLVRGFGFKDLKIGSIIPKIGTEELLLIALAAFLLFSKSGDKECAILVFLLIFIN